MKVPHPQTKAFSSLADFWEAINKPADLSTLKYPLVFKFDWGGEGDNVSLIEKPEALEAILKKAKNYEKTGQFGFVLQKFIPSRGMSLRVVVIHTKYISYWRRQENQDRFYTNLKMGAKIETESHPRLQTAAINAARSFCEKTGIDLAGFDFLFSEKSLVKNIVEPLFLEINYFFGRRGLGGSEKYYQILRKEIDDWTKKT